MNNRDDVVDLFHDTWVSYFELEAEELNVENSLGRLDRTEDYLEPDNEQRSFEAEEAEFYIDRFIEQAEEFANNLIELVNATDLTHADYVAEEETIIPYNEDSLPEGFDLTVKSFHYDPENDNPSEARIRRGVANLLDRYDRIRDRVEEHYEPMLGEGLPSIESELDRVENNSQNTPMARTS